MILIVIIQANEKKGTQPVTQYFFRFLEHDGWRNGVDEDATVDEEPSEYDEEEENQVDGIKPSEASSNNVTNNDPTVVPKVSDNNKTSSTAASTATSNNKIGNSLIRSI